MNSINVRIRDIITVIYISIDWNIRVKIMKDVIKNTKDPKIVFFCDFFKNPGITARESANVKIRRDDKNILLNGYDIHNVIKTPKGKNISPYVFLSTEWIDVKILNVKEKIIINKDTKTIKTKYEILKLRYKNIKNKPVNILIIILMLSFLIFLFLNRYSIKATDKTNKTAKDKTIRKVTIV